MSNKTLKKLLEVAARLSDRAADETGFVTLAALAREVQADVHFRPLLVEGVAAQPKSKDGRWVVLIDIETHRITDEMFAHENVASKLGSRVRNTVAHELAHALGPRFEELGVDPDISRKELVSILEQETEQLSPALLIPRRAMENLIKARDETFDISELVAARDQFGVSSHVFVRRFDLLRQEENNQLRHHSRLRNLAIGMGEWHSSDHVELFGAPFNGFSGVVPEFVALLRNRKKISVMDYFGSVDFYLNGGTETNSTERLWAGTTAHPRAEQMKIEISVETVSRKTRETFLWIARIS